MTSSRFENPPYFALEKEIYDEFIRKYREALAEFNKPNENNSKIVALRKLRHAFDYVDIHSFPKDLERVKEFHNFKGETFKRIKIQLRELGVVDNTNQISTFIANMDQEIADRLCSILIDSQNSQEPLKLQLTHLYGDDYHSDEATNWTTFLRTHTIAFLGGGNSRNFKVTCNDATSPNFNKSYVLKVDNRLGNPRYMAHYLRGQLSGDFLPHHAERQVLAEVGNQQLSRTLIVTDLCESGSCLSHAKNLISQSNITELQRGACNIIQQMCSIFKRIEQSECYFPDAKLTNWLVDKDNKVQIADTKSILFSNEGMFDQKYYNQIIWTPGYIVVPMYKNQNYKISLVHAALLGRNIYTYLTGIMPLHKTKEPFDWKSSIFNPPIGEEFKNLILELDAKPEKRLTIDYALKRLKLIESAINQPSAFVIYRNKISELNKFKFGNNDKVMSKYIISCEKRFKNAVDLDSLNQLNIEMDRVINGLNKPIYTLVRKVINKFDEEKGFFTIGMNNKARAIESAMASLSIEQRISLTDIYSSDFKVVREAIAQHRLSFGKQIFNPDGTINEDKSAESYKKFVKEFRIIKGNSDVANVEKNDEAHSGQEHT